MAETAATAETVGKLAATEDAKSLPPSADAIPAASADDDEKELSSLPDNCDRSTTTLKLADHVYEDTSPLVSETTSLIPSEITLSGRCLIFVSRPTRRRRSSEKESENPLIALKS